MHTIGSLEQSLSELQKSFVERETKLAEERDRALEQAR